MPNPQYLFSIIFNFVVDTTRTSCFCRGMNETKINIRQAMEDNGYIKDNGLWISPHSGEVYSFEQARAEFEAMNDQPNDETDPDGRYFVGTDGIEFQQN